MFVDMLVSPEVVECTDKLNSQPCEICHCEHIPGRHVKLVDVERNYITEVFEATGRNITKTAEVLDIARSTLHNKLDQYGLR